MAPAHGRMDIMPTYKLTYFTIKALGEPIRFILSYGGQEFEDVRVDPKRWPEIKKTLPFDKLPVLQIGDKTLTQSVAICRHLARQYDLVGTTHEDAYNIDMVVETFNDFRSVCDDYFKLVFFDGDIELRAKRLAEIKKDTLPYYLPKFEEIVKKNGGYLVNKQLTWADLYFTAQSDSMSGPLGEDMLKDYPNLKALQQKVMALPSIKTWIEKRPKTNY